MSSEELAFELVYERSDEATRIVMDLRRRGYSNTEIADITGTGIKRIQLLLKSISEEYEAAVAMAETTCWNTQEKELFLKLIIANRTTYEDVDLAGGGLSDDPDALARVAAFREAWFRVGTSTEPADRPRTEAAIARVYAVLGTSRPRFVWCDSPMAAQLLMYVSWGAPIPAAERALEFDAARTPRCTGRYVAASVVGSLDGGRIGGLDGHAGLRAAGRQERLADNRSEKDCAESGGAWSDGDCNCEPAMGLSAST